MIIRKEILRHPGRHNLGRANMAGPMIGGIARWRNPSGFFILRDQPSYTHFLTRHGFGGSGSGSFWGCGLNCIFNTTIQIPFLLTTGFSKPWGVGGFLSRLLRMKSQHCDDGVQYNTVKEVILTQELIEALKTEKGGFTGATLRAIGIKPYPPKGWTFRLRGTTITEEQYQKALEGRNTLKKKRPVAIQEPLFKQMCVKCGEREVYLDIGTMDYCEPCIWEFVKDD